MGKSGTGTVSQEEEEERKAPAIPAPSTEGRREKEDWIGRQLRRVFDDALHEPLPDDIMSLLERIDDAPAEPNQDKGKA